MEFFEKIYNESDDPSEFLHKINDYYIMFRKKFTNSDMENSFFLLSKKIFKKEDYSLYEWSSFSYYISNIYDVSKRKLVADYLKSIFETTEKALIFFKNTIIEIKTYRHNVKKYVKDDILFLMSHFGAFSSNDLGVFRTACEILEEEL